MAKEFESQLVRLGMGGLDLAHPVDLVPQQNLTRMTNAVLLQEGAATSREGLTALTNAQGTLHHSMQRINDPQGSTWTRIWGIDATIYRGQSGALSLVESGFSGDPLTMVLFQAPLSGDPWLYIADRTKMRKVRTDGLDLTIGLTKPAAVVTTALATELTVAIEACESGFTGYAGSGGAPALAYPAGKSANCLQITTAVGAATGRYYNFVDKGFANVDLTTFGGSVDATEDDLIHLWLKIDRPDQLEEVKIYLVCNTFTAGTVPGTSTTVNPNAYMKSFRASDFTSIVELTVPTAAEGYDTEAQRLLDEALAAEIQDPALIKTLQQQLRNQQRAQSGIEQGNQVAGRGQWTEYGVIGVALRRADFLRIGSDETVDWSDIRGICVVVQAAVAASLVVSLDDIYMTGGRGLDSTDPGLSPYDWRIINYDPRTGAKSNPSPEQTEANFLASARRAVTVTPAAAYGDAAIRQLFYRRGGALVDNWYYEGTNSSDGGAFTAILSDDAIVAAGTLDIDNDQPVPTVDENGTTVLAQPIPVLFGPVQGLLFGLGDPYRPGDIYWCKPDEPDHWPADNHANICAPSEELMNGVVHGAQAYCFSRKRMFAVVPNLDTSGGVTGIPTACQKGLCARWFVTVGAGAIFFGDLDGIYRTDGGAAVDLTDALLYGLFHGETINGYLPVDFTVPAALRLAVHDNELWFFYQDSGGTRRVLIFNLLRQYWRHYSFATQLAHGVSEPESGTVYNLILGGRSSGVSYTHEGVSDAGSAIAVQLRTASLDQGLPREEKLYGDLILDVDRQSTVLAVQAHINNEATALAAINISSGSGRQRVIQNPFGTDPQQARNLAIDVSWSSSTQRPVIYLLGPSYLVQPAVTVQRVTDWEDLGQAAEKYLRGVVIECDTGGVNKTVVVEATLTSGAVVTIDTLTVNATSRRKLHFSWVQVFVSLVRLRPTDTVEWKHYGTAWDFDPEPLRIAKWDTNWEDLSWPGDKQIKGVVLDCDTLGVNKTVLLEGDGATLTTLTVNANGRRSLEFSFTQVLARVVRVRATDSNVGKLYAHRWIFDPEPLALQRWETQLLTHGIDGWHILWRGDITLRSTSTVLLTVTAYDQAGVATTKTYTFASTGNVKVKLPIPGFEATKGVLYKYIFTATADFYLYRDESVVWVQPWQGEAPIQVKPFGDDDRDALRRLTEAQTLREPA